MTSEEEKEKVEEKMKPQYEQLTEEEKKEEERKKGEHDESLTEILKNGETKMYEASYFELNVANPLGKGAFGTVFKARCDTSRLKKEYAVRICTKPKDDEERQQQKMSISLLQTLAHENIVHFYGTFWNDENSLCQVMELAPEGSLDSRLNDPTFIECMRAKALKDVACALQFLHQHEIAHLNISPENVLIIDNHLYKITGFSMMTNVFGKRNLSANVFYLSPEQLSIEHEVTVSSDIWSFGVLCYEVLSGKKPFNGENDEEVKEKIEDGRFAFDDSHTDGAQVLISNLLKKDPTKRISMRDVSYNQWMRLQMELFCIWDKQQDFYW